jgi:hypothetical protein
MQFNVIKYDRENVTPKWIEFICSAEYEEYLNKKMQLGYFNITFKKNRYVVQIAYSHIDRISNVMKITVNVVSRISEDSSYDAETFRVMSEYDDEIKREADEQAKADKKVLTELRKLTSRYKVARLKEYLVECENTFKYEIVDKQRVYGSKQDEEYWFKYVWITQHTGYAGDDYSGTIFVPITDTQVFKFQYAM